MRFYLNKPKNENITYEFENLYQIVEFYVKEGEIIPENFTMINIEQHDEICSIKKKIQILEIIKKEVKYNKLFIMAKCKVTGDKED